MKALSFTGVDDVQRGGPVARRVDAALYRVEIDVTISLENPGQTVVLRSVAQRRDVCTEDGGEHRMRDLFEQSAADVYIVHEAE